MVAKSSYISMVALASLLSLAECQNGGLSSASLSSVPGAQTGAGILASSADGMSRYLAPNGPIQPALTAIGGLPMRGTEVVNDGITRISSGLDSGAKSLSQAAGQNGQIRMPGMQAMESMMPASVANMGEMMQNAIRSKNNFIRGQAERGIQAGQRLGQAMTHGLQARSGKGGSMLTGASNMMSGAQDAMTKGAQQIKSQLQQSLGGTMGRMQQMQGIGQDMRNQAQGVARTLSNGLQQSASQLQRTGEQVVSQLQGGMKKTSQQMSGVLGSFQGSMGNMGQNAQKNIEGIVRHAQQAASQVTNQIQQAAQMPINMIQQLGSNLGGMMKGGSGGGRGGRY